MIPIYWINLEKAVDRRNRLMRQFKIHGLTNHRVEAVAHSVGKIGCSLSHIKAIWTAYRDGNEFAIICEDDVDIGSNPMFQMDLHFMLDSFHQPWDIVQLHYLNPKFLQVLLGSSGTSNTSNEPPIRRNTMLKGYFMSCAAYVINRRAMEVYLHMFVTPDETDLNRYHVKVALDHPRATPEELAYRYLNTYCSLIPLVNVREEFGVSSVAMDPNQYVNNFENMELVTEVFKYRPYFTYRVNQVYELPYDLHWSDTVESAEEHVRKINAINPS